MSETGGIFAGRADNWPGALRRSAAPVSLVTAASSLSFASAGEERAQAAAMHVEETNYALLYWLSTALKLYRHVT